MARFAVMKLNQMPVCFSAAVGGTLAFALVLSNAG